MDPSHSSTKPQNTATLKTHDSQKVQLFSTNNVQTSVAGVWQWVGKLSNVGLGTCLPEEPTRRVLREKKGAWTGAWV